MAPASPGHTVPAMDRFQVSVVGHFGFVGRAILPAAGFQPAWPPERRLRPRLAALQDQTDPLPKFPPEWRQLCGVMFPSYAGLNGAALVWNASHPIVRQASAPAWEWCAQTFMASADPAPYRDKLLSDTAAAASWLLPCISRDSRLLWNGLPERDPKFLPELFRLLYRGKRTPADLHMLLWVQNPPFGSRLQVIDPQQWATVEDGAAIRNHLPKPSVAWTITRSDRPDPAPQLQPPVRSRQGAQPATPSQPRCGRRCPLPPSAGHLPK
jgi:hypothetical protein